MSYFVGIDLHLIRANHAGTAHRTAHVLSVQNMINRNAGNKYLA